MTLLRELVRKIITEKVSCFDASFLFVLFVSFKYRPLVYACVKTEESVQFQASRCQIKAEFKHGLKKMILHIRF